MSSGRTQFNTILYQYVVGNYYSFFCFYIFALFHECMSTAKTGNSQTKTVRVSLNKSEIIKVIQSLDGPLILTWQDLLIFNVSISGPSFQNPERNYELNVVFRTK